MKQIYRLHLAHRPKTLGLKGTSVPPLIRQAVRLHIPCHEACCSSNRYICFGHLICPCGIRRCSERLSTAMKLHVGTGLLFFDQAFWGINRWQKLPTEKSNIIKSTGFQEQLTSSSAAFVTSQNVMSSGWEISVSTQSLRKWKLKQMYQYKWWCQMRQLPKKKKKKAICTPHLVHLLSEKQRFNTDRLVVTQWLYREKINSI